MANVLVEEASLQAVANAIRSKTGGSDAYTPSQMGPAIQALETGSSGTFVAKTVTAPGTYTAANDNADGYSSIINIIPWYEVPLYFDENPNGYVMNGKWSTDGSTVNYSDIYEVKSGHTYLIQLGSRVGTRFRALYTTQNTHGATSAITGTMVSNISNPAANASVTWTAPGNGYLSITKDNAGTANIKTFVFDTTIIE